MLVILKGYNNDIHAVVFKGKTNFYRFNSVILENPLFRFYQITFLCFAGFSL